MLSEGIRRIGDGLLEVTAERLQGLLVTDDINDIYDVEQTPFARGKFAAVRRAVHKKTDVHYAAKFLRRRRRAQCTLKEIGHEIAILMLCADSKHIVKLNAVHETKLETALILELATGGELQAMLDEEDCLTEQQAQICMREILKALQYLHKKYIAHLDLKPQNILLCGDKVEDGLKLCDFGISRVVEEGGKVREILGTPDYVAPEVLQYEPLSLQTDIWSVGVLTYVLLTGCSPFGANTKQETFLNISQCALTFPDELFEDVSPMAIDFIKSALRIKPHDRMTATECLEHLWLNEDSTSIRLSITLNPQQQQYHQQEIVINENDQHENEGEEEHQQQQHQQQIKTDCNDFLKIQNSNCNNKIDTRETTNQQLSLLPSSVVATSLPPPLLSTTSSSLSSSLLLSTKPNNNNKSLNTKNIIKTTAITTVNPLPVLNGCCTIIPVPTKKSIITEISVSPPSSSAASAATVSSVVPLSTVDTEERIILPVINIPNNINKITSTMNKDYNKENILFNCNYSNIIISSTTQQQQQQLQLQQHQQQHHQQQLSVASSSSPPQSQTSVIVINTTNDEILINKTPQSSSSASASVSASSATSTTQKSMSLFPDAPTTPKVCRKSSPDSPPSVKALVKKFQLDNGTITTAQAIVHDGLTIDSTTNEYTIVNTGSGGSSSSCCTATNGVSSSSTVSMTNGTNTTANVASSSSTTNSNAAATTTTTTPACRQMNGRKSIGLDQQGIIC